MTALRERLCWLHPDGEPEFWGTDYVGVRNENGQVVPACRPCADRLGDQSRLRDGSEVTEGSPC